VLGYTTPLLGVAVGKERRGWEANWASVETGSADYRQGQASGIRFPQRNPDQHEGLFPHRPS
jgi:hypothetical protein